MPDEKTEEAQLSLVETMEAAYNELDTPEETAEVETPQAAIPDPAAEVEEPEVEIEAKDETEDQTATTDETEEESETDTQPLVAPKHWSDDDKAMFSELDVTAQEYLLRRSRQTEADYTHKTQALAEQRKALEPLEEVLAPYRSAWSTQGVTDAQAVQRLLGAHVAMTQNPLGTLQYLAQTYGADLTQLAPSETQSDYTDPDTLALKQEIESLKAAVQQQNTNQYTAQQTQAQSQIDSFASAVDAEGNLIHPHFDAVQTRMAALVNAERALGNEPTLQDVYDQAVQLDPKIRERVANDAAKLAEQELEKQAAARAAKAKRAAKTNIRATGSNAGTNPSFPDDIKEGLREAQRQLGG